MVTYTWAVSFLAGNHTGPAVAIFSSRIRATSGANSGICNEALLYLKNNPLKCFLFFLSCLRALHAAQIVPS